MKRFVSIVLTVTLIVMTLPITCFALEVGGIASWNYDEVTSTLTLNNYSSTNNVSIGEETCQIHSNGDLNIILEGTNTLDLESDYGIYVEGSLIISGTGALNVSNTSNGIYATKNITIKSGNISAPSIQAKGGGVTVDSGKIELTGSISANDGQITINNGEIKATRIISKDITVNNGNINAYLYGTNLVEINDGKITSNGLYVEIYKTLRINGGTIEIKSNDNYTAVDANCWIYITGGTLIIENTYSDGTMASRPYAIYGSQGTLNISGGNIKIKGNVDKDFTISAGTLEVEGTIGDTGTSYIRGGTVTVKGQIYSGWSDLSISGGLVNVESNSIGLYAPDGDISISGGEISIYGESQALKAGSNITINSALSMKTGASVDDTIEAAKYYSEKYIYLAKKYHLGDLDGDSELSDWDGVLLARYLAGWNVEIPTLYALDIDGDGEITDWDGVVLDRYLAGWNISIG